MHLSDTDLDRLEARARELIAARERRLIAPGLRVQWLLQPANRKVTPLQEKDGDKTELSFEGLLALIHEVRGARELAKVG